MTSILERAKQVMQPVTPRSGEPPPSTTGVLATRNAQPAPQPPDVATLLSLPLPEFGARHLALRVRLPNGSTCHFVSGGREVAVLRGEGVPRGEIWTAAELRSVLGDGWTRETIATLIAAKRDFDGTVDPAPRP